MSVPARLDVKELLARFLYTSVGIYIYIYLFMYILCLLGKVGELNEVPGQQ